ncbi:MAG: LacI family transcriptional regulator, partial [Frondihabitans sp.]|nr:LacI family transcriptional regulator [Frondihabitans sp.]
MLADVGLSTNPEAMIANFGSQVDVVVGYFGDSAPEWIQLLGRVPVVELDPVGPPERGAVLIDPAAAIEELAEHFVTTGVGYPAILDSSWPDQPSTRSDLLRAAFERRGYLPQYFLVEEATAESAAKRTTEVLSGRRRLDAIVTFNDLMAIGTLNACIRAGVDVPGRMRVVGVDGLSIGRYVTPTLTTLDVDLDAVGRNAVELAVGISSGAIPPSGPEAVRRVEHRLLLRESA